MNWFNWIIFFVIVCVIPKIGDNKNSLDSLNVLVNYHFHSKNRVITLQFPFMGYSRP